MIIIGGIKVQQYIKIPSKPFFRNFKPSDKKSVKQRETPRKDVAAQTSIKEWTKTETAKLLSL